MKRAMFFTFVLVLWIHPFHLFSQTNVLSGEFNFNGSSDGWTLNQGEGARAFRYFILFEKPFETAPTISLSILGFDVANDGNLRYRVKVEQVTTAGFAIKISTWNNTKIYAVEGQWRAIEGKP